MWNNDGGNNNDITGNLLDALSLLVGLYNLELNNQQSRQLMSEMSQHQNTMLAKIIKQNEVIIEQNNRLEKLLQNLLK